MYRRNRFWKTVILRYGKKSLVLAAAFAVLLTGAVSGTLAWMIDNTNPITNTFTYGDINIKLEESDADNDGDANNNSYEMMPGATIAKDPKVTVLAGSKDSWLFVKLDESENFKDFLTYEIAAGWDVLEGETGVYYREVKEGDQDQAFDVLKDNQVKVKDDVTKEMLNALNATGETSNYPTLTITAYAVQYDEGIEAIDTVEEAWALAEEDAAKQAADAQNQQNALNELSNANDDQSAQGDTPETT